MINPYEEVRKQVDVLDKSDLVIAIGFLILVIFNWVTFVWLSLKAQEVNELIGRVDELEMRLDEQDSND